MLVQYQEYWTTCIYPAAEHGYGSWGKSHVNTDGQQLHGRTYMTCVRHIYLEYVLSLRRPIPFTIGGLRWTDRWTDGQKLPNNCSNPSAYDLRRGLIIIAIVTMILCLGIRLLLHCAYFFALGNSKRSIRYWDNGPPTDQSDCRICYNYILNVEVLRL